MLILIMLILLLEIKNKAFGKRSLGSQANLTLF